MKKIFTILIIISALILVQTLDRSNVIHSRSNGAPAGHTGSPADGQTCATIGCHAASPMASPNMITGNIPPTGYIPGQTYTMMAVAADPNRTKFGFQVSPQDGAGNYLGTMMITNPTNTKLTGIKYITHTSAGTSGPGGSKTWSFDWVAPAAGTGDVTFYGAFNLANGNGTSSGDIILTSSTTFMEDVTTGISSADDPFNTVIYPVPAVDNITVRMYVDTPGRTIMELVSMTGQTVASLYNNANMLSGNQEIRMELPDNISEGIYYLRVVIDDQQAVKKLVIN